MIKIDGLVVHTYGEKSKKQLLFIHGFPFNLQMWTNQIEALKDMYYCVTYDVRGLGQSDVGDGQYTMESFVDDIFAVMDGVNLDKPILCGISMGGYAALRAVEKAQDKFGGLILFDSRADADTDQAKLKRAANIKQINSEGLDKFIESFLQNCFSDNYKTNFSKEYNLLVNELKKSNPNGVKGCLLAMQGRTSTKEFLPLIKIPALIICGEADILTSPVDMKVIAEKIPAAKFKLVPGAGHMTPIENPQFVNKVLKEFLKFKE
jgi:pimeloyl-ACP methyl ester carboxylesterase